MNCNLDLHIVWIFKKEEEEIKEESFDYSKLTQIFLEASHILLQTRKGKKTTYANFLNHFL